MHPTARTILVGLLLLGAAYICIQSLTKNRPKISEGEKAFHVRVTEELAGLIAADHPEGGTVLILLPPDAGRRDAPHEPIMKALQRAFPAPAWSLATPGGHIESEGRMPQPINPDTGEWQSGGYRTDELQAWIRTHRPTAIFSLRGLPVDARAPIDSPDFYLFTWGGTGPEKLAHYRRHPVRACITYKGIWAGKGLTIQAPEFLDAESYQVIRFSGKSTGDGR